MNEKYCIIKNAEIILTQYLVQDTGVVYWYPLRISIHLLVFEETLDTEHFDRALPYSLKDNPLLHIYCIKTFSSAWNQGIE